MVSTLEQNGCSSHLTCAIIGTTSSTYCCAKGSSHLLMKDKLAYKASYSCNLPMKDAPSMTGTRPLHNKKYVSSEEHVVVW